MAKAPLPNDAEPDATETKAPESIGKYKIVRKIGSGGMGAVFLATDTQMRRNVALKLLPKEKAQNPTLVRRFYAEVQAAAALKHENIVMVYDAGEAAGYHYMALEFVDGQDAADLIAKRDRIPVKRTIEIIRQTALALEHAHSANIVHRDIKPANLLIRRDGVVKVADLGLARSIDEAADTGITRAGTTVGTVDYMSPEQARDSKSADARSDIYSLGCTWYHLLTGSPPFTEGSMTNKLRAHAVQEPPNPQSVNDAIPDELVAVLHRMMAKKAVDRHQSVRDLVDDLDELANTGESRTNAILGDGDSAFIVPKPRTNRGEMVEIPDDSAEEITKPTKSVKGAGAATASQAAKPGKRRRPPRMDGLQDEEEPTRDYSMLVYGGLVAAAIGVVAGLGYLVAGFGGAFDAPSKNEAETMTAADGRTDEAAPVVISTVNDKSNIETKEPKEAAAAKTNATAPKKLVDLAKETTRIEFEKKLLPDWTSRDLIDAAAPQKLLASQADAVVGLNDAIGELSSTGGQIRLSGAGPFELRASSITLVKPIRIAADDPSVSPVVLLTAPSAEPLPNAAFVSTTGASLELSGLDLQVAPSVQPSQFGGRAAFFAPLGDGLRFRHCRITGPASAAVVVALRTQPDGSAVHQNVLFDSCSIRGAALSLFETLHADVDLVVLNSLAATDAEPMLRFILPREEAILHHLRTTIVGSTLACGQGALQWQGASNRLLAVDLVLVNTLIATPDDVGSRFAEFYKLSSTASKAAFGQRIRLRSVGSYLVGWNSLSFATPENVPVFPHISEFLAAWDAESPLSESNVIGSIWPVGVEHLSTAPNAALDASTSGKFKTVDGSTAGASRDVVSRLPAPLAIGSVARTSGSSPASGKINAIPYDASTLIPAEFFRAAADGQVIRVDLNREDLGRVLTERPPATGSLIVATGSGQRTCTPFQLRDVWVRIRFEQTDGPPLVLTPRGQGPALISVHNGGIALEGVNILFVTSERNRQPQWVLSATDSDVLLDRCRLWGPTLIGGVNKGLIHVVGEKREKPSSRPFSGEALAFVGIANSFLGGGGNAIDMEARGRELFVDNSVLAGRDHSVRWNIRGSNPAIGGSSRFRKTTFSAPAPVHLDAFDLTQAGSPGHAVVMEACLFTPSLKDDPYPGGPSVMTFEGATDRSKPLGLAWSEQRCGYSAEWTSFIRPTSQKQPVGQTFDSVWKSTWGAAAIVDPLVGRNGVVLVAKPIRQRPRFELADYALADDCTARTHDSGAPIGADLSRIPSAPISTPGSQDKSDKPDAKPDSNKPSGKKSTQPMGF